jgi:glutamate synthase (NADPH/NADH) small chain
MVLNKSKPVRIAVIGSGPAGLACATQLVNAGHQVTVFDELNEFGGMLAYGIPEFRIPLRTVKEKIVDAKKIGVKFEKKKITSTKTLLKENGGEFDFVVLAIGSGSKKGPKAGYEGEEKTNTIDALEFLLKDKLEKKKMILKGERIAVIGGGNSAIDAARVALRQGGKATILYRRTETEMPALRSEIEAAKKDGICFEFLRAPIKCDEKNLVCAEMVLGDADTSGRKKPVDSGKRTTLEFDKIILAIGQEQDLNWLEKEGITLNGKLISVDSNNKTSLERVYACGDCVTGPKTIASATVGGIKTAKAIIESIK